MNSRAFTILEILIYIALTAIVLTFLSMFAFTISSEFATIQDREEAHTELVYVTERIRREIERARGVNIAGSVFNANPGRLALRTSAGGTDVIELILPGGYIHIRRASGTTELLTTPDAPIASFIISNYSQPKRPGILRFEIISAVEEERFSTAVSFRELILGET